MSHVSQWMSHVSHGWVVSRNEWVTSHMDKPCIVGCPYGIWVLHKTLVILRHSGKPSFLRMQKLRFKKFNLTMQIKIWLSWVWDHKTQYQVLEQKLLLHAQNSSRYQFFGWFQESMSRAKYVCVINLLQYDVVKSYGVSKSPNRAAKTLRLTVSVFLCSLELTVLLLKSFHLHLFSDTLI